MLTSKDSADSDQGEGDQKHQRTSEDHEFTRPEGQGLHDSAVPVAWAFVPVRAQCDALAWQHPNAPSAATGTEGDRSSEPQLTTTCQGDAEKNLHLWQTP